MAKHTKDKPGNPDNEPDYEVGYGKPPTHSRFRKGQSGNPRGWTREARDVKSFLAQELDRKQRVTVDGKVRWLTNRQISVVAQIAKARKGDPKAFRAIMEFDAALQLETEAQVKRQDLSADERATLTGHLEYIRRKRRGDADAE
jgi:hypothetical protein